MRVPASTSNLGPGFDCLGVALRVYNHVQIARAETEVEPMIAAAAAAFFEQARLPPFAFSCAIFGAVPQSRGLGSSVTVRLGVLHGLNELEGQPLQRDQLFQLCASLEGHPDNAAPAEYGGFNVVRGEKRQSYRVSAKLRFVLLVPNFEIQTAAARSILPEKIGRTEAVESCGNACMITAAFATRNYNHLKNIFGDHLHQPYRQKLIAFLPRVIAAAEEAGALGAWLSGSGSTIAAVTLTSPERVAEAMRAAAESEARTIITIADNQGTLNMAPGRP